MVAKMPTVRRSPSRADESAGRSWPSVWARSSARHRHTHFHSPPPPSVGPGWAHEMKLDGYRLMARVVGQDIRMLTRTGLPVLRRRRTFRRRDRDGRRWLFERVVVIARPMEPAPRQVQQPGIPDPPGNPSPLPPEPPVSVNIHGSGTRRHYAGSPSRGRMTSGCPGFILSVGRVP
jgi:hypothetical protein